MRIDLGFSVAGGSGSDRKYIHITRKDVMDRIRKNVSIDQWTKDYLFKRINDYPDSALIFFVQNINQIVGAALNERSRIRKEQDESQSEVNQSSEFKQSSDSQSGSGFGEVESQKEASQEERESLFSRRPTS
jgi:hypothetical protein